MWVASVIIRRVLATAVAVLLLAAGLTVYLIGPASGGDLLRSDPPLPRTDYPIPPGSVFVSPTGADSAAGTRSAPLRTLTAAVRAADPDDTVVLREGTYRERVGMIRKRLTIQPYPGERVWFKGSRIIRDWQPAGRQWQHTGWRPDLCDDCHHPDIVDDEHPLAGRPQMVFLDGRPLRQVGSRDAVGPGTFYADTERHAVLIGDDPDGRLVEVTADDHLLQFDGPAAAGSMLRGVGVAQYGSNQDYGARGAMVVVNAADVTVARSTFAHSASTGLAVFQPGGRVVDSTLVGNGLVGLLANRADGLRITGSRFAGNNAERFTLRGPAVGAAGAKITRTRRPYVADNRFTGNLATGWWCDLGCTDATVVRNVADGNLGHGLYYEVSSRAVLASNVLAGNRRFGVKVSSSDRVRLYHNTFTGNGTSIGLFNDPRDPGFDGYSSSLGLRWITEELVSVNNLFVQQRAGRPVIDSADYKPDTEGNPAFVVRSDGNGYLRGSAEVPLAVLVTGDGRARGFAGLPQLRSATGFERHGLSGRPRDVRFTDPGGGDYTLRPGSAGVRRGVPMPAEAAEALGVPADRHPDIGVQPPR